MPISVIEKYKEQKILLLGGLGFIGKVLLYLFLQKIPSVGSIYLLLRGGNGEARLNQALRTSPVFHSFQNRFDWIKEKIRVIDGDASLPDFGIKDEALLSKLKEEIDLVINSAGLVTFNPDLKDAIDANLMGTIYTAKFVQTSKKGKLLHLSTCYVAGNVTGMVPERINPGIAPNGKPLNFAEEMSELGKILEDPSRSKQEQIDFGIRRANEWGWPNIYTYTKALGEFWLQKEMEPRQFTIVRPSIVESAISIPFPGWNEGFNTTAPLIQATEGWSPYIVTKKENIVDIIPVDILSSQIIKIGALLLDGSSEPLYQCATSSRNPLQMERALRLTRKKQRELLKTEKFSLKKWLKAFLDFRAIHQDHPFSYKQLYLTTAKLPLTQFKSFKKASRNLLRLSKLIDTYLPFLYENNYLFSSSLIDKIPAAESEFNLNVNEIDWDDYWPNIHLVGIKKWCIPKIEQ